MVKYDSETALIVVDAQNDFADPAGSLYVPGGEEAIAAMNEHIRRARAAGALVAYTQDWHPGHTPHFAQDGGIWPVHCVAESWGAAFHPALDVVDGPIVKKGTEGEDGYSGFTVRDPQTGETSPTELEGVLRERGITNVVVVGLATDYCVKETAIDAARAGFSVTVPRDGIRAVNLQPGDGEKALAAMQDAGAQLA
ncbi:MAG: isochorismatase family protein [Dehalococcoidia bacterium]|nr:isochorismatase family protein [Dehalococcoidia bacterium]